MSYTEIKKVTPNADVIGVQTFRNAHRWSAYIYNALAMKYLGAPEHTWIGIGDELWKLVDDPRLASCERITMAITFDLAWGGAPDVPDIAAALREFDGLHVGDSHLTAIADLLECTWEQGDGVAFYGMSVSQDLFQTAVECKTCGQETDERRPFNVRTDPGAVMLNMSALEDCTDGPKFYEGPIEQGSR
tara:strand:- start:39873 stop:40439 length:567 start_codon:yes stop_codon:yes gene_type:complete